MTKKRTIKVVTLSDLDSSSKASCDCGPALKAPHSTALKMKLGLSGFGKHCVVAEDGEVVRCFNKASVAKKIARGFGPGFRVKTG